MLCVLNTAGNEATVKVGSLKFHFVKRDDDVVEQDISRRIYARTAPPTYVWDLADRVLKHRRPSITRHFVGPVESAIESSVQETLDALEIAALIGA